MTAHSKGVGSGLPDEDFSLRGRRGVSYISAHQPLFCWLRVMFFFLTWYLDVSEAAYDLSFPIVFKPLFNDWPSQYSRFCNFGEPRRTAETNLTPPTPAKRLSLNLGTGWNGNRPPPKVPTRVPLAGDAPAPPQGPAR